MNLTINEVLDLFTRQVKSARAYRDDKGIYITPSDSDSFYDYHINYVTFRKDETGDISAIIHI